jgi:alpha-tubulin suppressor-like RCC1 family protein
MLQCWGGLNHHGELGLGHKNTVKVPGWVQGIHDVRKVVLAGDRTCAVVASGELFCWGLTIPFDHRAQVPDAVRPARVTGLTDIVDVAIGDAHACALDNGGQVHCWGRNASGQLGLGSISLGNHGPGKVPGLTDVAGILADGDFNVAWTRNGELYLWGQSFGSNLLAWAPRKVRTLSGVRRAWLFGGHTCALVTGGKVRCFIGKTLAAFEAGKQHDFARALAAAWAQAKPGAARPIKRGPLVFPDGRGLSRVVDVVLFRIDASAVTESGEVFSWGSADMGTVGRPAKTEGFYPPTRIAGISDAVAIAGSWWHRCVLHKSGAVSCFGKGGDGRLGTAYAVDMVKPVRVSGIPKATALASNNHCTFAIGEDKAIWVWGESERNACGFDYDALDDSGDYTPTPVPVKVPLSPYPP